MSSFQRGFRIWEFVRCSPADDGYGGGGGQSGGGDDDAGGQSGK